MEITENKLKEILTEQRVEFQHVVGIFKEDLESKISLIGEQYQDIKATLDGHSRVLESHSQMLESHSRMLESHSRILESHTEMIGSLAEDVQIIKSDVQFLKAELKRKVDYDEFDALAKRVSLLEAKIRK